MKTNKTFLPRGTVFQACMILFVACGQGTSNGEDNDAAAIDTIPDISVSLANDSSYVRKKLALIKYRSEFNPAGEGAMEFEPYLTGRFAAGMEITLLSAKDGEMHHDVVGKSGKAVDEEFGDEYEYSLIRNYPKRPEIDKEWNVAILGRHVGEFVPLLPKAYVNGDAQARINKEVQEKSLLQKALSDWAGDSEVQTIEEKARIQENLKQLQAKSPNLYATMVNGQQYVLACYPLDAADSALGTTDLGVWFLLHQDKLHPLLGEVAFMPVAYVSDGFVNVFHKTGIYKSDLQTYINYVLLFDRLEIETVEEGQAVWGR